MSTGPNLSLPDRSKQTLQVPAFLSATLLCLLVMGIANLSFNLYDRLNSSATISEKGELPLAEQRELALKLEQQGLTSEALSVWIDCSSKPELSKEEQAKIWYRIGTLHQENHQPEKALAAYYRSEALATISDLEHEIGRRTQECLENSGKFAALKHELTERVSLDPKTAASSKQIVAEIGSQKITSLDLDRKIESQINKHLSLIAPSIPKEKREQQKELMFNKLASGPERAKLLNQLILEELLYRKAREDKLADNPEVREMIRETERNILSGQVLVQEMKTRIHISDGDVQTYYEAHKDLYSEAERARIRQIVVPEKNQAEEILKQALAGADFSKLAETYSTDEKGKNKGGTLETWLEAGSMLPELGYSEEIITRVLESSAEQVLPQVFHSKLGYHLIKIEKREGEKIRPLENVRSEIYQELMRKKQEEVQQTLLSELTQRYGVVVHRSVLNKESADKDANNKKKAGNK